MKKQIQQGDVLFLKVSSIPENTKIISPVTGRYIIAKGEATGHSHSVVAEPDIKLYEKDGALYLSTASPVVIEHQEHEQVTIEKGVWEIGQVIEIDPFDEEIRKIQD